MTTRQPSLFVSHGSPMHAFGEDQYQVNLQNFAKTFPKPKAIIALSAHSVTNQEVLVLSSLKNDTLHDFSGFPKELYQLQYPAPGLPELSERIQTLLLNAGFDAKMDENAPLDHGIWIPLLHLYPKADIPIIRISLPIGLTPTHVLKMGHTVAALRNEGCLILGTGGAVHNLRELVWNQKNATGAEWALNFEKWILRMLEQKKVDELTSPEESHPDFHRAHPSMEHYLPLLFTLGAALKDDALEIVHQGVEYSTLSMLTFALNQKPELCLN